MDDLQCASFVTHTCTCKVNRGYFRSLSRYAQRKQGLDFSDRYMYVVAKCCLYMHSTIVLAENVALVFLY